MNVCHLLYLLLLVCFATQDLPNLISGEFDWLWLPNYHTLLHLFLEFPMEPCFLLPHIMNGLLLKPFILLGELSKVHKLGLAMCATIAILAPTQSKHYCLANSHAHTISWVASPTNTTWNPQVILLVNSGCWDTTSGAVIPNSA
jgi:hypothetical protein